MTQPCGLPPSAGWRLRLPQFAVAGLPSLSGELGNVRDAGIPHLEPFGPGLVEVAVAVLGCLPSVVQRTLADRGDRLGAGAIKAD